MSDILEKSPLNKAAPYVSSYTPSLLWAIPRNLKRQEIGMSTALPFMGGDTWNAYELSWLDESNKPHVAMAEFYFSCDSECLIESKSFKLYLNSFNQTQFKNTDVLVATMQKDLSEATGCMVKVRLILPPFDQSYSFQEFQGQCLDDLDIAVDTFTIQPEFLVTQPQEVEETLYSNLLKSNCLVTNQPDWASVFIHYRGKKIQHEGLLKYIISFRNHNGLQEQCVERIFMDIMRRCQPEKLTVYARYTRRGGLETNPFRSNFQSNVENVRTFRQ